MTQDTPTPLTDAFVMREFAERPGVPLTAAECLDFARSLERQLVNETAMREQAWIDKGIAALQEKLAAAERDAARLRELLMEASCPECDFSGDAFKRNQNDDTDCEWCKARALSQEG